MSLNELTQRGRRVQAEFLFWEPRLVAWACHCRCRFPSNHTLYRLARNT